VSKPFFDSVVGRVYGPAAYVANQIDGKSGKSTVIFLRSGAGTANYQKTDYD
jgi:hypothetical protein